MHGKTKISSVFILTILSVTFSLASQLVLAEGLNTKTSSGGVNHVTDRTVDLGIVNIDGGMIGRVFELYNGGSEDLVLKGAFTSCACTKASIELSDGTLSRPFGMSIPTDWFKVVKPGDKFKVHVQLDPAFHGKDGTGKFHRDIYLITSAPPDGLTSARLPMIRHGSVSRLRLKGEVVTANEYGTGKPAPVFTERVGDFFFPAREFDAGIVKQSAPNYKLAVPFRYEGKAPAKITGTPASCGCVSAHTSKTTLNPGDKGTLTIDFNPNYHKEPEGRFFKDILILTDPPQAEEVRIRLWAQVDLDLGEHAYENSGHDEAAEHSEEGEENH